MKIAAIYCRVSSVEQSVGTSLDRQRSESVTLAESHGYRVPKNLEFSDAMSGRRSDRPGFRRLLDCASEHEFERCYVWTVDRFGRSLRDAVVAVDDLKKLGIDVYSVKEGDLTDPIRLALLSAIAEREVDRIRERTLPAKNAKRDIGLFVLGRHPYGYRKRADKTLEKCPIESAIVRQIFTDCIHGLGRIQIARRLNSQGHPPPEMRVRIDGRMRRIRPGNLMGHDHDPLAFHKWCEEHGAEIVDRQVGWSARSISRVLENTASCGILLSKRTNSPVVLQIAGAPIISRGEFDAARRSLSDRFVTKGRRRDAPWLLTGLIACDSCGGSYIHHESGKKDHRYVCRSGKAGARCRSPSVKMNRADLEAIAAVRGLLFEHLGSDEQITNFLANTMREDRGHLKRRLKEQDQERLDARAEWERAERRLGELIDAGAKKSSIPTLVRNNEIAKAKLDAITQEAAATMAALNAIDIGMLATASEIRSVLSRVDAASYIVVGRDSEPTADVFTLVRTLVQRVGVRADGSLAIDLKKSPSALMSALNLLHTTAVRELRHDMLKVDEFS